MWKNIGILCVLILCALIGYLLHAIQTESLNITLYADSQLDVSYADMIAIILTVFGVIFAIVSIALATAAVVGWNSIEAKAMRTASGVIRGDLVDSNGKLHRIIKAAIADTSSPLHQTLKQEAQNLMYQGIVRVDPSQESEDQ